MCCSSHCCDRRAGDNRHADVSRTAGRGHHALYDRHADYGTKQVIHSNWHQFLYLISSFR